MKISQGLLPCSPIDSLSWGLGNRGSRKFPFVPLSSFGLCLLHFQKKLWEGSVAGGSVAGRAFSGFVGERKDPMQAVFLGLTRHDEGLSGNSWDLYTWRFLGGFLVAMVTREEDCVHMSPYGVTIPSFLRSHHSRSNGLRVREGIHHLSFLESLDSSSSFLGIGNSGGTGSFDNLNFKGIGWILNLRGMKKYFWPSQNA